MYGTWPDGSKILCSYNPDLKTCDAEDYFTTVSLEWILPGLLLGLGAVITTAIAYIVYASCCCKCCQWCAVYGASHYLIKGKFLKHRSHFWKKVYNVLFLRARMYRVLSIVTSLLIICFLFVILGIQIKVETATATFRTRSETFAVTQANVLDKGVDRVNTLPSAALFRSQTSNELVAKTKAYVKDIRDQTDKVDAIKDAELGTFIPEMVFITLLICLATCGMLISLWGQKQLLLIYAICIILALLPIFLYWSSSTFLEAIFSDVCSDKDLSAEGGNSAIKYGIVNCNGSSLADMRTGLVSFYKEVEVKACIYTQRMCITPNIKCPTTTCNIRALPDIIEKTSILDNLPCGHVNCTRACQPGETTCYSRNMTLPACTKYCKNVSLQNTAISSRTLERDAIMFGQYYSKVFMPVASCHFVDQYLHYIDRPLCKDMMMIGVSAVFTLLVAILFTSQFFIVLATHMTLQKKEKSMYEMAYHPDKSATS